MSALSEVKCGRNVLESWSPLNRRNDIKQGFWQPLLEAEIVDTVLLCGREDDNANGFLDVCVHLQDLFAGALVNGFDPEAQLMVNAIFLLPSWSGIQPTCRTLQRYLKR